MLNLFLFVSHSVMFLQFVPKTHLFFTAGKDKKIKQWDADKFELIQTLEVTLCSSSPSFSHLKKLKRISDHSSFVSCKPDHTTSVDVGFSAQHPV